MTKLEIAIIGAGHGGCAAAVHMSLLGHRVRLFNRTAGNIAALQTNGGIKYSGVLGEGFVNIPVITTDIEAAVTGAQVVMVVTPRYAHPSLLPLLKPVLRPEQIVFLNTGCGSSYLFRRELGDDGPVLAETNTLTYACRRTGTDGVAIYLVRKGTLVAVLPDDAAKATMEVLTQMYEHPHLQLVSSPLETLFNNNNAVMHPPGMIANSGLIERQQPFRFYAEGTTPGVGRIIDALDEERGRIMKAAGIPFVPFIERFYQGGYTTPEAFASGSAYRALTESAPNREIMAPQTLEHRYLLEDVGWGLVPMEAFAAKFGVDVPVMSSVITLAGILSGHDFRREGLSLSRLGLGD